MAENNDIGFSIEINGVETSLKNLKEIKQAIKELQATQLQYGEGTKEFEEASKKIAKLKDRVDDLNDSTNSLKGSGIERATQGFNLLGDGLRNLDFDKVKVGLTALKSALAATGIMLLVQGVIYLIENFDELSKGSGILAKALRFVGDIVSGVVSLIYKLTDAIGLTNSTLDKMSEAIVDNAAKAKEAIADQTKEYDRQIAVAKASGKNAIDLEIAKQQAIIETNRALLQQTLDYIKAGGELTDEQKKLVKEQSEAIKDANNAIKVIKITAQQEDLKREKDKNDKLKELYKQNKENYLKELESRRELEKQIQNDADAISQQMYDKDKEQQDAKYKYLAEQKEKDAALDEFYHDESLKRSKEEADRQKQLKEQQVNNDFEYSQKSLQATQALTDLYFNWKISREKKGSAESLALMKKQFNVNKAFSIVSAGINTAQAVMQALANFPPPASYILAALNGVLGAAQIAAIASKKFDGGGAESGGGGSPSISIPSPPTISTPNANVNGTKFDENGNKINSTMSQPTISVKAHVVETEMTDTQNTVNKFKKQNTF